MTEMIRKIALTIGLLLSLGVGEAWAVDAHILTPDSGKKLDTKTVTTTEGTVHRQSIVNCNETDDTCAPVTSSTGGPGVAVTIQNKAFGSLSDDAANPTDKFGVLPCVTKTTAPSWTNGNVVPLRCRPNGSAVIDGNDTGDSNHTARTTAGTNITNVTAVATVVRALDCLNPSTTTAALLRIYNKASNPVIASDTALVVYKQLIPAADSFVKPGGLIKAFPAGLGATTSGFSFTITGVTAASDLDNDDTTNAPADVICNFQHSPATS